MHDPNQICPPASAPNSWDYIAALAPTMTPHCRRLLQRVRALEAETDAAFDEFLRALVAERQALTIPTTEPKRIATA